MKLSRVVRPGTLDEVRSWILASRPAGADVRLDGIYYVLIVDGRRVAAISLRRFAWYATEVKHLVVVPEERRKGYGRTTLRLALERVRTPLAVATVRVDNQVSPGLFRSEGFREVAAIPKEGCGVRLLLRP